MLMMVIIVFIVRLKESARYFHKTYTPIARTHTHTQAAVPIMYFTLSMQVPPVADIVPEADPILREWNKEYHLKRLALREKQEKAGTGPLKLHTFFTMDCSHHSLWQAMVLEMSWAEVKQGGFLSRVISGCQTSLPKKPSMLHHVLRGGDAQRIGSYFTPTFSRLPNGDYYAPYNRPNGIWFWLNHTDLTEEVFMLIDPDMLFIKRMSALELVREGSILDNLTHFTHFTHSITHVTHSLTTTHNR